MNNILTVKICGNTNCKNPGPKSITEFDKDGASSSGFHSWCKDCISFNYYLNKTGDAVYSEKKTTINRINRLNNDLSKKCCSNPNCEHLFQLQNINNFDKDNKLSGGRRADCKECRKIKSKKYYDENIIKINKKNYEYRKNNPEKIAELSKCWRENNKEKVLISNRIYSSFRQTRIKKATPPWANLDKIKEFYITCREKELSENILYEVDHIIPLQGKTVCGLHVETNLQVITKKENRKKGNKFPT